MNAILQEGLRLASLGLSVHWLRCPQSGPEQGRGKAPVRKDWQRRAALSVAELRAEYRDGYNIGLHTGLVTGARTPLVVVDIDGPQGRDAALRAVKFVPPVRAVTTRGEHWYFRHPGRGLQVPTRLHIDGEALDVLGESSAGYGHNVVLPPSVHPSGAVYAWADAAPDAAAWRDLPVYQVAWFAPPPPQTGRTPSREGSCQGARSPPAV